MPKVSVIMPAYNAERYIGEALQSILAQNYSDFESVVVNDGSTDATSEILKKYEPKVKVLSENNSGPASARNLGISEARGEYVAFLDADDIWNNNKLAVQVDYMDKNPHLGFSYTNAECFSAGLGKDTGSTNRSRVFACDIKGSVFKDLFWNNFIINSTVMVRRSCFDEVGLLDESRQVWGAEDYEVWLRLSRVFELGHIPELLTKYRLHENSLIGDSYNKAFRPNLYIYKKLFSKFQDTEERLGMSYRECSADLCFRYAYKNMLQGENFLALQKVLLAVAYLPQRAIKALPLVLTNNLDAPRWQEIIPKFDLWHKINSVEW